VGPEGIEPSTEGL